MVVNGKVPMIVAREMYNDPVGKTDIRVAGHAGAPPPEEWAEWFDSDGNLLLPISEEASDKENEKEGIRFVDDPSKEGNGFVDTYHIDTEAGLRVFADTIKRHGLA